MDFLFDGVRGKETSENDGEIKCPFLRKSHRDEATLSFYCPFFSVGNPSNIQATGPNDYKLEDTDNLEHDAYQSFHGSDGLIPLSSSKAQLTNHIVPPPIAFQPLAASAASFSLSAFGPGAPFGFDYFMRKKKEPKKNKKKESIDKSLHAQEGQSHIASGAHEWLRTGNCPIAKLYRALHIVLPLVAKALQPPSGMKLKCPAAVVAARAALSRTSLVRSLRPLTLTEKVLAVGSIGMAMNLPLGVWREHTAKFSVAWFVAIHASVPFIAMLRKAVFLPNSAMAYTIAAAMVGQVIGSRMERARLIKQDVAKKM